MGTDTLIITALSVLTILNMTMGFTSIPLMFEDWNKNPLRPVWKATYDVAVGTTLSGTVLVLVLATGATDVIRPAAPSDLVFLYILTAGSGITLLIMIQPVYWPRWKIGGVLNKIFYKQTPKTGNHHPKPPSNRPGKDDPPPYA